MTRVLVVDDNPTICLALSGILEAEGHDIETALSGEDARILLTSAAFDVVVIDIGMPRISGIDLLSEVHRSNPDTTVLMMTGDPTIASATKALQGGAFDYLVKPFTAEVIQVAVGRAAGVNQLKQQKRKLEQDNLAYQHRLEQMVDERTTALRASEARLAAILAVAPVGIFVSHQDVVKEVNPAFCDILGYTREELLACDERLLYQSAEHRDRVQEKLAQAISTAGIARLTVTMQRKDGSTRQILLQAAPMSGHDGKDAPITFVAQDMTDQLRLQAERDQTDIALRQAQKMDAIGRLAAGIAHEINTPSQFVMDNLTFLRDAMADLDRLLVADHALRSSACAHGEPLAQTATEIAKKIDVAYLRDEMPKSLGHALEGMQHIKKIIVAMKEFSHPVTETKTLTDLNHVIENTLTISRNEWKYVATSKLQLDPGLPQVLCIPGEISQVLLNLIVNASHAIADARPAEAKTLGTITISTVNAGDWIEIHVADTGTGIPAGIRDHVFEPFFTTKAIGKGTGQGLALAWSVIVDKHRGTLSFDSTPGLGTTFTIRLPIGGEGPEGSAEQAG